MTFDTEGLLKSLAEPLPEYLTAVNTAIRRLETERDNAATNPWDTTFTATLHRTVDPILATLHRFEEYHPVQMEEPVMALARAINQGGSE